MDSLERSAPLRWWLRVLVAISAGVAVAVMVAVLTRLDTRLISAFRGDRTVPYRAAFFVALAALCATSYWRSRGARPARAFGRVALVGMGAGYLAGFVSSLFVSFFIISGAGAWKALTSGADGLLIAVAVPVVTFSWFFGFVAYAGTDLALRLASRRT